MPYFLTIPRNAGSKALKAATASRRAFVTACACDAGRMGMMDDRDSSVASISAISRSSASPFFGPETVRKAQRKTRNSTRTAVGSGSSLCGAKFGFSIMRTPVVSSRSGCKHGRGAGYKFNGSVSTRLTATANRVLAYGEASATRARDAAHPNNQE